MVGKPHSGNDEGPLAGILGWGCRREIALHPNTVQISHTSPPPDTRKGHPYHGRAALGEARSSMVGMPLAGILGGDAEG